MRNKPRVLVADDLTNVTPEGRRRSRRVLDTGVVMARRLGCAVDLLFVEDFWDFPDMASADRDLLNKWHGGNEKRLQGLRRLLGAAGRTLFKSGVAAEQILRVISSKPVPEMAVVGTQGRRGLDRLIVGSTSEEVIRNSKVPVLVLGPGLTASRRLKPGGRLRILLPTNLGPNSRQAESYGLDLARRLRADLTLFHALGTVVWATPGGMASPEIFPFTPEEVLKSAREDAERDLRKLAAKFRKAGVRCGVKLGEGLGAASARILRELERGYDMVLLGTHGRSRVLSSFFGSVVRETILKSPVPVITVHSRP